MEKFQAQAESSAALLTYGKEKNNLKKKHEVCIEDFPNSLIIHEQID